jgi:DNA-binding MarR family transcriptional regulator
MARAIATKSTTGQIQLERFSLHLLHRAWQCAEELFQAQMTDIDLTTRQYAVLAAAANKNALSQQDIMDRTGSDRSTVSQVVQTLTRKGLLRRRRSRKDARVNAITLTPSGRDILKACKPVVDGIDAALLAALPQDRARGFLDSLRALIAANGFERGPRSKGLGNRNSSRLPAVAGSSAPRAAWQKR